jgi:hypothetical protein
VAPRGRPAPQLSQAQAALRAGDGLVADAGLRAQRIAPRPHAPWEPERDVRRAAGGIGAARRPPGAAALELQRHVGAGVDPRRREGDDEREPAVGARRRLDGEPRARPRRGQAERAHRARLVAARALEAAAPGLPVVRARRRLRPVVRVGHEAAALTGGDVVVLDLVRAGERDDVRPQQPPVAAERGAGGEVDAVVLAAAVGHERRLTGAPVGRGTRVADLDAVGVDRQHGPVGGQHGLDRRVLRGGGGGGGQQRGEEQPSEHESSHPRHSARNAASACRAGPRPSPARSSPTPAAAEGAL